MEALVKWLSHFFQGVFWHSLLNRIQWVDYLTVTFVIMGLIYGGKRGFLREVVEVFELSIILFVLFAYQKNAEYFFIATLPFIPVQAAPAAAFIILMTLVWLLVAILDRQFQKWVHTKLVGVIRITGGMILGIIHFLVIWSIFSQAILIMPLPKIRKFYDEGNSVTGQKIRAMAPAIYKKMAEPLAALPGRA